jgi:hypothetical protein
MRALDFPGMRSCLYSTLALSEQAVVGGYDARKSVHIAEYKSLPLSMRVRFLSVAGRLCRPHPVRVRGPLHTGTETIEAYFKVME